MRSSRRFSPKIGESVLEARLVLSHLPIAPRVHVPAHIRAPHVRPIRQAPTHPHAKLAPVAEINAQVAAFSADLQAAEAVFVQSLPASSSSSSSTTPPTNDTGGVFQSFMTARAMVMSQNLVAYFNSLKVELPRTGGPPGVSGNPSSIQLFLQQTIVGVVPTSLTQQLLAIPLPTTTGPGVTLFDATAQNVVQGVHTQMLNGMRSLFQGIAPVYTPKTTTTSTSQTGTGTTG